jgi:hypothetical protein
VTLSLPTAALANVDVIDASGRCVSTQSITGAGSHTVAVRPSRALPGGLYLVRVRQGSESRSIKVVLLD